MAELVFDSRVNYQKIYMEGEATLSVANPDFLSSTTITHDLGHKPSVRVWFTNASGNISTAITDAGRSSLYPVTSAYDDRSCYYKVSNTTLTLYLDRIVTVGATVTSTIYYRIYLDGA